MSATCKHKLPLCKLNNCKACGYEGDEEHCPMIEYASEQQKIPTFAQMFAIYNTGNVSYKRKKEVVGMVRNDLKVVGMNEVCKADEMTRTKFRLLIASFRDPNRVGGVLRDLTIESHLSAFRAISSKWLTDKYEEHGLEVPTFPIPMFRAERPPVQQVSDRQVRQFTIQIEKWLATGRESDRSAFVYSWFALFCGMRAGDICLSKWSVLKRTDDGIMLVYEPHKTAKYHKTTAFRIDHKVFCMIEPLIGGDDEYVIPRHENRIPKHLKDRDGCGEYKGMHVYLRNKVNAAIAACWVGTEYRGQKKSHALRKYFETDMAMQFGRQVAARMACHSLQQQGQSYLGTPYGKVSPFPTVVTQ